MRKVYFWRENRIIRFRENIWMKIFYWGSRKSGIICQSITCVFKGDDEMDWQLLPFIILFSVYPLLDIPLSVKNRYAGYYFAPEKDSQFDLYLVGKGCLLLVIAAWVLIILFRSYRKKIKIKSMIPELLLLILLLISSFHSIDPKISFMGANELFEPFPVIFSYLILLLGAEYILTDEEKGKRKRLPGILCFSAVGSILVSAVGIVQFFNGMPTVSTLYNPDYVGTYSAIMLPLFIISILGKDIEKGTKQCFLVITAIVLNAVVLIMSKSLAGIAGCVAGIIVGRIMMIPGRIVKKSIVLSTIAVAIFVTIFVFEWKYSYIPHDQDDFSLATGGEYAEFSYRGEKLLIKMELDSSDNVIIKLLDENGSAISYESDSENRTLRAVLPENSSFYGIHFNPMKLNSGKKGFIVFMLDRQWYLGIDEEGNCRSVNAYGKFMDMKKSESSGIFSGRESFFHGRGYIWDRTIPLIKNYLLFGCGSDAFPLVFPQNDINKVLRSGLAYEDIILKPHSLYLQILTQLGLPFLLIFLFIVCSTIRILIRTARKENDSKKRMIAAAITSSVIAFLVVSLINDSSLCVTPLAIVILGTGRGCN